MQLQYGARNDQDGWPAVSNPSEDIPCDFGRGTVSSSAGDHRSGHRTVRRTGPTATARQTDRIGEPTGQRTAHHWGCGLPEQRGAVRRPRHTAAGWRTPEARQGGRRKRPCDQRRTDGHAPHRRRGRPGPTRIRSDDNRKSNCSDVPTETHFRVSSANSGSEPLRPQLPTRILCGGVMCS